jgi:probable phosphoglycerate mutase
LTNKLHHDILKIIRRKKMKNIMTIQHTQAEHHVTKMVGGNTDWSLTELGKEQAHNIGKNIKDLFKDKHCIIYSSDQIRAKQTAEIINGYLNFEIIYRQDLREINVGEAKGKSREWHDQHCAPRENISLTKYRPFPNAETFEDVYNRIGPIIDEFIGNDHENIIIVGHGLALLMFLLQWLKIPVDCLENIAFNLPAGGVSSYSIWENKRMLKEFNVTSYMKDKEK